MYRSAFRTGTCAMSHLCPGTFPTRIASGGEIRSLHDGSRSIDLPRSTTRRAWRRQLFYRCKNSIQNHDHHVTPPVIKRAQTICGADDPVYDFFVDNYAFTGPFKQYSFPEEMPTSFLLKALEKRGPTADGYDENGQSIITGHVDEDSSNHNMTWCYCHGHTSHGERGACEEAREYDYAVCI